MIIVSSNNGNDSTECCGNGECTCSSLFTALINIDNNTVINITSESVTLNNTITMGSGSLTSIIITGSNVTIMCNYSGSVYCESCDDVTIEGITWDRCGNPNETNIAGVTLNGTSNISIVNCTFQHSHSTAVSLLEVSDDILIQGCNFLLNTPMQIATDHDFGILNITRSSHRFSERPHITITIFEAHFYNNTYPSYGNSDSMFFPINIDINDTSINSSTSSFVFKKVKFKSNENVINFNMNEIKWVTIQLLEISLFNNTALKDDVKGCINLYSASKYGDLFLYIVSSTFAHNNGSIISVIGNKMTVMINGSNFTDSKSIVGHIVEIVPEGVDKSKITFYRVQFSYNQVGTSISELAAAVVIYGAGNTVDMCEVNFTSNQQQGTYGGALLIYGLSEITYNCYIFIRGCKFVGNSSPGHGAAMYIDLVNLNTTYYYIPNVEIVDTCFDQNIAGSSVVYVQSDFSQDNLPILVSNSTFTNNVGNSLHLSACDMNLSGILFF